MRHNSGTRGVLVLVGNGWGVNVRQLRFLVWCDTWRGDAAGRWRGRGALGLTTQLQTDSASSYERHAEVLNSTPNSAAVSSLQ